MSWLKEWDLCVFKGDKKKMNAAGLIKKERRNRDGLNGGKRKWDAGGSAGGGGTGTGGFEEQVRLSFYPHIRREAVTNVRFA